MQSNFNGSNIWDHVKLFEIGVNLNAGSEGIMGIIKGVFDGLLIKGVFFYALELPR